jgi:sugar O-acyltransferase (sialic acid O-acetyltransferase NeuD family)
MKDIFIIGTGGFAKEVHFLIRQIGGYKVKAFVGKEASNAIEAGGDLTPVIDENELGKFKGYSLALGIGDPKLLLKLSEKFRQDFLFPNIIHPNVIADWKGIKLGEGNIICSGVNMTTDIQIGSYNIFNLCCTVGHDTVIGNCNVFNPGSNISGGINIEHGILLGTNATILQYRKIGANAIVGAAGLVTKDVESNTTVVGLPAKILSK